jgi:hypothetical protein
MCESRLYIHIPINDFQNIYVHSAGPQNPLPCDTRTLRYVASHAMANASSAAGEAMELVLEGTDHYGDERAHLIETITKVRSYNFAADTHCCTCDCQMQSMPHTHHHP